MSIPGANPPDHDPGSRTISEATRCVCGHRWDEHNGRFCCHGQQVLTDVPFIKHMAVICGEHQFEPAERDEQ